MSITGTGTELDPFIVHSYTEIKEVLTATYTNNEIIYALLDNDIDCNSYGTDWTWDIISTPTGNQPRVLDLGGHTIKNLTITTGSSQSMFKGYSSTSIITIRNGKLLNIFGSSIKYVLEEINMENLSISFQVASVSQAAIKTKYSKNCAIYGIMINVGSHYFIVLDAGAETFNLYNMDIYFEMYGIHGGFVIQSGATNITIEAVRLKGKMETPPDTPGNRTNWIGQRKMTNSVIDVDMSKYEVASGTAAQALIPEGDKTTVINWDTINETYMTASGYIKATTAQMTVGSELRSLGFLVVNVEGT